MFCDYPPRIYIKAPRAQFTNLDKYKPAYEHLLWKTTGELVRQIGCARERDDGIPRLHARALEYSELIFGGVVKG